MLGNNRGNVLAGALIVLCVIAFFVLISLMDAGSRIFGTWVDRKVAVTSHQYQEGKNSLISMWEANKAEVQGLLTNPNLTEAERANLNAQLSAINIQLRAARDRQ